MKKYYKINYKKQIEVFAEEQLLSEPYGAMRYIDNLGGVRILTGEEYLSEALRAEIMNIDDSESAEYNVAIINGNLERFKDSVLDDIPLQDMLVISWTDKNLEGKIVAGDKNNVAQLFQAAFDESKDADTLEIEEISKEEYNETIALSLSGLLKTRRPI